jgi:ankyrin repeat protein
MNSLRKVLSVGFRFSDFQNFEEFQAARSVSIEEVAAKPLDLSLNIFLGFLVRANYTLRTDLIETAFHKLLETLETTPNSTDGKKAHQFLRTVLQVHHETASFMTETADFMVCLNNAFNSPSTSKMTKELIGAYLENPFGDISPAFIVPIADILSTMIKHMLRDKAYAIEDGKTGISRCIEDKNILLAELMIIAGCSIHTKDADGTTAFMSNIPVTKQAITRARSLPLVRVSAEVPLNLAGFLERADFTEDALLTQLSLSTFLPAELDFQNTERLTLLMICANKGYATATNKLLEMGATPNARLGKSTTALSLAQQGLTSATTELLALLKSDVDREIVSKYCCSEIEPCDLITSLKATYNAEEQAAIEEQLKIVQNYSLSCLHLVEYGASPYIMNEEGFCVFSEVCRQQKLWLVTAIFNANYDDFVGFRDFDGNTALIVIIKTAPDYNIYELIQHLTKDYKEQQNVCGETALWAAAKAGNYGAFSNLLRFKAKTDTKNSAGESLLAAAAIGRSADIAESVAKIIKSCDYPEKYYEASSHGISLGSYLTTDRAGFSLKNVYRFLDVFRELGLRPTITPTTIFAEQVYEHSDFERFPVFEKLDLDTRSQYLSRAISEKKPRHVAAMLANNIHTGFSEQTASAILFLAVNIKCAITTELLLNRDTFSGVVNYPRRKYMPSIQLFGSVPVTPLYDAGQGKDRKLIMSLLKHGASHNFEVARGIAEGYVHITTVYSLLPSSSKGVIDWFVTA